MVLKSKSVETIELGHHQLRALIDPATINEETRSFEIVVSTGARARQVGFIDGEFRVFEEELEISAAACDLSRFRSGTAPLLNTHGVGGPMGPRMPTLDEQLGIITRAFIKDGELRAAVTFSFDPKDEGKWTNVKKGVIRAVSAGYDVLRYDLVKAAVIPSEGKPGRLPVYRASKWIPYEASLLPIQSDIGARVRARTGEGDENAALFRAPPTETHSCEVFEMDETEDQTQAPEAEGQTRGKTPGQGATTGAPAGSAAPANTGTQTDTATAMQVAEREVRGGGGLLSPDAVETQRRARADSADIVETCVSLGIEPQEGLAMIRAGTSLADARAQLIAKRAAKDATTQIRGHSPVQVGRTELDTLGPAMENALLVRLGRIPEKDLTDEGRQYRGMRLLRMAEANLEARGIKTRGMMPLDIATRAMAEGGHSTSDFPIILGNVTGRTLRDAYMQAPQTWKALSKRISATDFKDITRVQLGEGPMPLLVNEGGEFLRGTMTEAKEKYRIRTYGRRWAITRQALINDDLSAFDRVPMLFARQFAELESNLAWALITGNVVMGDGVALFHANHGNLGSGVLDTSAGVASLSAMRTAMRKQKGVDGTTALNVIPRQLIVPAAKETAALQLTTLLNPNAASGVNPFQGAFRNVIVEPRLDAASAVEWYAAADPNEMEMLEHAYLDGQEGLFVETRNGFEIDGMEMKVRKDFGVAVIEWRGLYKSSGV